MTGGTLNGTNVNIVLFGDSHNAIKANGGTIDLAANMTTATPAALNGVLFYNAGGDPIDVAGGVAVTYSGTVYSPTADITWHGNPAGGSTCTKIIGKYDNDHRRYSPQCLRMPEQYGATDRCCDAGEMMRRIRNCTSGSVAVEFALVALPLFMTLLRNFRPRALCHNDVFAENVGECDRAGGGYKLLRVQGFARSVTKYLHDGPAFDCTKTTNRSGSILGVEARAYSISAAGSTLTVQVSAPSFSMLMPFWGDYL